MDQEMQRNPDYNLVMKFLSSITPGDMDKESADQLMMIGQRIQAGGSLTDKEREMFLSVVSAMPEREMSYEVDGQMERMSPEMMDNMVKSGQISQGEARLGMDTAMPSNLSPEDMRRFMDMKSAAQTKMGMAGPGMMPSKDGVNYSPSSGVTMEPNVMTMEEAVDAGLVTPTRPRMRPAAPMQSPRPQARPMR